MYLKSAADYSETLRHLGSTSKSTSACELIHRSYAAHGSGSLQVFVTMGMVYEEAETRKKSGLGGPPRPEATTVFRWAKSRLGSRLRCLGWSGGTKPREEWLVLLGCAGPA